MVSAVFAVTLSNGTAYRLVRVADTEDEASVLAWGDAHIHAAREGLEVAAVDRVS